MTRRSLRKSVLAISAGLVSTLAWSGPTAQAATQRFAYTGGEQVFTVPAGVRSLHAVGVGARGGADGAADGAGGFGSKAAADLAVTPGEVLYIEVGGNGTNGFGSYVMGSSTKRRHTGRCVRYARRCGMKTPMRMGRTHSNQRPRTSPRSANWGLRPMASGGGPGSTTAGGGGGTSEFGPGSSPGALGVGGLGAGCGPCSGGGGGGGGLYGGGGGGVSSVGAAGGGGGSSAAVAKARNLSIVGDTTGSPSVTITYGSNAFELGPAIVTQDRTIAIPLELPGPGTVKGVAKTKIRLTSSALAGAKKKTKTITYGRGKLNAAGRGLVTLKIPPSAAAKKGLKTARKLKVNVAVTFTPIGGRPGTKTTTATVFGEKRSR